MPRSAKFTDLLAHPIVPRALPGNVEDRISGALGQWRLGRYSLAQASRTWKVPYGKLRYRSNGQHSVQQNGGNRTLLTHIEDVVLLAWAHRRVVLGIHFNARSVSHAANEILCIGGKNPTATVRWAKRWKDRHSEIHSAKAKTRTVVRREADACLDIEMWFTQNIREHSRA